jgi:cell division protein FtsW
MTLPFISSGGSSMLGIGLGLGMLLALSRRRVDLAPGERPHFFPKPAA